MNIIRNQIFMISLNDISMSIDLSSEDAVKELYGGVLLKSNINKNYGLYINLESNSRKFGDFICYPYIVYTDNDVHVVYLRRAKENEYAGYILFQRDIPYKHI